MIIKKGKVVTLNEEGLEFARKIREERPFILLSTPTSDGQIHADTEFIVDSQRGNYTLLKYKDSLIVMTGIPTSFVEE